jgi:hypothetical protein
MLVEIVEIELFMGLEGSLLHVQEPCIFRCPEADE